MFMFVVMVPGIVFVVLVGALMWALDRWLSAWAAIFLGAIAFAFIAYSIVSGIIYCSAEPIYIPPSAADAAAGSEGFEKFNCDSAGGAIDYLYLYLVGPVMLVVLGVLTLRHYLRARTA